MSTNKEKLDVDEPRFCFDSQSHFYMFLKASPLLGSVAVSTKKV